jgi:GNAT superfamily N-acetyltransferase
MNKSLRLSAYGPQHLQAVAQGIRDVLSVPPIVEMLSLNDILSQLETDTMRDGFGGLLLHYGDDLVGMAWWYGMSGRELHSYWRPRFAPKEAVPTPAGEGAYLARFGLLPGYLRRGLGTQLLTAAMDEMGMNRRWLAATPYGVDRSAQGILAGLGFEALPLRSQGGTEKVAMLKQL